MGNGIVMSQIDSQTVGCTPVREENAAPSKVSWRGMALRVGISGLTLAVLFYILPREQLWAALQRVSPVAWALAVAVYMSLHLLGILKWRLTVNLSGAGLGWIQAARCYYAGLFATLFLPSILGGDVVRAGLAFGRTRCRTGLVVGSILDRLIDFTSLATLATLGAILMPDQLGLLGRKILLPLAGAFLLGALTLAAIWFFVPARRLSRKVRRRLVKLRQAVRPVFRRPHFVLASLTLGVLLQSSLVLLNAWLGRACGLECSLAVWFFVWPLAKLSAVLPVTQGGVGVREAALAALFLPFGVAAAVAVAVGLVFQSVVITGGFLSGPLSVALGRFPHPQEKS